MTSTTLKIFIAVNQEGEFSVSPESVASAISDLHFSHDCEAIRAITINVTLDLPVVEAFHIVVPAQEQAAAEVTVS